MTYPKEKRTQTWSYSSVAVASDDGVGVLFISKRLRKEEKRWLEN